MFIEPYRVPTCVCVGAKPASQMLAALAEGTTLIAAVFPLRADRRVLISATISVRSRSSAVSRATSSAILASICIIVKIGLRQCYPTSACRNFASPDSRAETTDFIEPA